ncbi:insulinase family protein [bacterium]|nr:insulinase family protein [bacterium]
MNTSNPSESSDFADTTPWKLENGLQILALELPSVDYISMDLVLPVGVVSDPEGAVGSSLLIAELLTRGTHSFTGEELLTAFDDHGIRYSTSASLMSTSIRLQFLPEHFRKAVTLLKTMLCEPLFPEDALDPVKALFLHDLRSLRENPSRWAMNELSRRYFPAPFHRSSLGEEEDIGGVSRESLVNQWQSRFGPGGGVLSIAGRLDLAEVRGTLEEELSSWEGQCDPVPEMGAFPERKKFYLPFPGNQQQLVFRYPSAPMESEHYYAGKVLSQLLSGGMFGRLFIEVREKRGLCYSVYAQHSGRREYGSLVAYAGTTPERVHETAEVMGEILRSPIESLGEDELRRAKNNLLSQIVLSEESTSARSRSNAVDWLLVGRVRSLQEVQSAVLSVGVPELQALLAAYPLEDPAAITLGAENFGAWNTIAEEETHS